MLTEIADRARTLPATIELDGHRLTFRLMQAGDQDAVLAFTRELREEDLLFLRLDITRPEVVDQWIENIEAKRTRTVVAIDDDGKVLGYGSIHLNDALWTRHLGEIRLLVVPQMRGHGLGRALAEYVFTVAQDLDLSKLVAQMMSTQHDAQDLFHHLGFIPEAMLHDWVIDRAGRTHDLILMAREVDEDV
ncbi:MAG: GNAT family N-acetyltransferase [Acidobacteriota bacterium]